MMRKSLVAFSVSHYRILNLAYLVFNLSWASPRVIINVLKLFIFSLK